MKENTTILLKEMLCYHHVIIIAAFEIDRYFPFYVLRKEVTKRLNSKEDQLKEDFIGCYLQEMEKKNKTNQVHNFTCKLFSFSIFIIAAPWFLRELKRNVSI